ncbi:MAG: hypothetical protein RLZZ488_734 [Pseudomonadota bacterium]|jgi:hypothetical protein
MLSKKLLPLIALVAACHPRELYSEAQSEPQKTKKPLQITGTWQATEVWSLREENGQRKAVHTQANALKDALWRVKIEIDSDGRGFMNGLVKCVGPATAMSGPKKIHSLQIMNALLGLLSLPKLIDQTKNEIDCAKAADGNIASVLGVSPSVNFIGQKHNTLPKNLGVFGETQSLYSADKECNGMRGVRFVNVQQASACVGFTDASANKIRFLIIPVGEIYAVRVNLKRD